MNEAILGAVLHALSAGRNYLDSKQNSTNSMSTESFQELKKNLDLLIASLSEFVKDWERFNKLPGVSSPCQFPLNVSGLSNLMCALLRLAIKDENPKLSGIILKMVLLLADKKQYTKSENDQSPLFESGLLVFSVDALRVCCQGENLSDNDAIHENNRTAISSDTGLTRNLHSSKKSGTDSNQSGSGLNRLFSYTSKILIEILPATSGFSQQTIEFLHSKKLFVQYNGFNLEHLESEHKFVKVTETTTTLSADSVVCAVSASNAMGKSFDHIWMDKTLTLSRKIAKRKIVYACLAADHIYSIFLVFLYPSQALSILSASIVVSAILLNIDNIFHGFHAYDEFEADIKPKNESIQSNSKPASAKNEADSADHGAKGPDLTLQSDKVVQTNAQTRAVLQAQTRVDFHALYMKLARLFNPIDSLGKSLKGNQSVVGHVLCLTGLGSLKSLKILITAPIDVFEAPAVRAAVEGMWSRFSFGFYVRGTLYVVQLVLFSAFVTWCISQDLTYSMIQQETYGMGRVSFTSGCVAAGIGAYFMMREVLQCFDCVADEGLKIYIEVWNIVQVCCYTLEMASLAMFCTECYPINTKLIATYAIFGLWINLLHFTKAFSKMSFLLEILTTIISDVLPFLVILFILVLAVTFALLALVGIPEDRLKPEDPKDSDLRLFTSYATILDLALRMAEGRQDLGGSSLEKLAADVGYTGYLKQNYTTLLERDAIIVTIYLCFYFLFFFITIVALNALIALMGSSYEKVMEKKISQRYKLLAQIIVDEKRIMRVNVLRRMAPKFHSIVLCLLGSLYQHQLVQWFLPSTFNDFEEKTKWTHVLSASSDSKVPNENLEIWDGKQGGEWIGQLFWIKLKLKKKKN